MVDLRAGIEEAAKVATNEWARILLEAAGMLEDALAGQRKAIVAKVRAQDEEDQALINRIIDRILPRELPLGAVSEILHEVRNERRRLADMIEGNDG